MEGVVCYVAGYYMYNMLTVKTCGITLSKLQ
jgi:hypothetical protein